MSITYELRRGGVAINALTVTGTLAAGSYRVQLLNSTKDVIATYSNMVGSYNLVFNLPLDTDGNPVQGTYYVRVTEEVWGSLDVDTSFVYTYNPVIPSLEWTVSGFTSEIAVRDVTSYTGLTFINRVIELIPPPLSPLQRRTTSVAELSFPPNIYSGIWTAVIRPTVAVYGAITILDEPETTGTLRVYPQLSEEEMYWGLDRLFGTYREWLETAKKKALDIQPLIVQVANLIHQYIYNWRRDDRVRAYQAMLAIYEILRPIYLNLEEVVVEILPWAPSGMEHTHSHLSVLEQFSHDGVNLKWNNIVLPLSVEADTGRVRMDADDTLTYLEGKVDGTTIEVFAKKFRVRSSFIEGLAGTNMTFSNGKYHVNVEAGSENPFNARRWSPGTYMAGAMVYKTDANTDVLYIAKQQTTQEPPGSHWRIASFLNLLHARNQDVKLGNVFCAVNSLTNEVLVFNWWNWWDYNHIGLYGDLEVSYVQGVPGVSLGEVALPTQDMIFGNYGVGTVVLKQHPSPAAGLVRFDNHGGDVTLLQNQTARYRYNQPREMFELVGGVTQGGAGIDLSDLSAAMESVPSGPAFSYNSQTGVFTLNTNLNAFDNSDTEYISQGAVEAIVNALFALLEHDQLANISGVDGGTVHVTTAKVEEWDAKQEAVAPTAPAFPLLSTPLTPNRLLISNDDGQVAVSSVSESDIQMLQESGVIYSIRLNNAGTVGGRLVGLVEGVDYPMGWVLNDDDAALVITHGMNRRATDAVVFGINGVTGAAVKLQGNIAYATMTNLLTAGAFNAIRLDALATVAQVLVIDILTRKG